jgi:TetR/AcrR family transcriptional regulator, tetracycline repressor protein
VRAGLSKGTIVQAALDVLNDEGMDGVTVRAVARRLGVQAPALYWHVKDKQELVDEMGTEIWRRVSDELLALEDDVSWRDRLTAFATITRRVLLSHRDGAKVFSGTYLTDADILKRQESILEQMAGDGFTVADAVRAFSLLYSFTIGFCIEEQAVTMAAAVGDDRYSLERRAQRLDAQKYPQVVESGPHIFGDADARFNDLVEVLVNAIGGFTMNERDKRDMQYPPPEAEDPEEEESPQIDPLTIEDAPEYPGPGA